MTMTSVDVDDALLTAAQAELGTTTKRDTINAALQVVATRQQRSRGALTGSDESLLELGLGPDIDNADVMARARR